MNTQPAPSELGFAEPIRDAMGAEKKRLERFFLTRVIAVAVVIGGIGFLHDPMYTRSELVDNLMMIAATAVTATLTTAMALNVPAFRGLLWALREGGTEPSKRYARVTSGFTVALLVLPLWLAVLAPLAAFGLVFALIPLGVFVSNSMLAASTSVWARETAELALAQAWSAESEGEGDPFGD